MEFQKICETCEYCGFGKTSSFVCYGNMYGGASVTPVHTCPEWCLAERIRNSERLEAPGSGSTPATFV